MPESSDAQLLLQQAEQAVSTGDLDAANALLKDAAHLQESELGPQHPDLANTLNNLAIVAERRGEMVDAEQFYRRAVAIASAALPADHPMVAASRQNLEEFCSARHVPLEPVILREPPVARPDAGPASTPVDGSAVTPSRLPVWSAIAVIVLIAVLLVSRPWSSPGNTPEGAPSATPSTAPTAPLATAEPPPSSPAPKVEAPPPTPTTKGNRPGGSVADRASAPATGTIGVALAQVCQQFSSGGGSWQCTPIGEQAVPGSLVLFTRIRSPQDTAVVHRWYLRDSLRKSVKLTVGANASEGYRTYSRQPVNAGEEWRVEVTTGEGDVLFEQRFAVRQPAEP